MKKAYSYIRFSTPDQQRGDSLRRQVEASRQYCERSKLVLDDTLRLRDLGVSAFRGRNAEKGALSGFLAAVDAGKVQRGSVLIVESLDRLSRNQLGEALNLFMSILRAGVNIVTLTPEREYSRQSCNDIAGLIEPLVVMSRANEESAMKSKRLAGAWDAKRQQTDKKLTGRCPAWMKLSADRRKFEFIPSAVATVKRIVRLVLDGVGTKSIAKRFNGEEVPTIGRAGVWHDSYICKILHNRGLFGEFQPMRLTNGRNSKRVPVGDPVQNYFPPVITEGEFFKIQQALAGRMQQRGRTGACMTNLFTGLVRDASDKATMTVVRKDTVRLVSSAATRGERGSQYVSFPYAAFENAFLSYVSELKPSDILPPVGPVTDHETELAGKLDRLAAVEGKLGSCKKRAMDTDSNFEALLDVMRNLENQRAEILQAVEQLKAEIAKPSDETIHETQKLIEVLQNAKGEELLTLRTRLRGRIKSLVSEMWVQTIPLDRNGTRVALVQIHFTAGGCRKLSIMSRRGQPIIYSGLKSPSVVGGDLREGPVSSKLAVRWGFDLPQLPIAKQLAIGDKQLVHMKAQFAAVKAS